MQKWKAIIILWLRNIESTWILFLKKSYYKLGSQPYCDTTEWQPIVISYHFIALYIFFGTMFQ